MRPLDPRLLRHAAATRWLLVGAVVVGVLAALAAIGYAASLAILISRVIRHGADLADVAGPLGWAIAFVIARAVLAYVGEFFPRRSAVRMTSQLRRALVHRVLTEDRGAAVRRSPASLINLATTGVAGLEQFAARFLPQLMIASIVPLGVVVYVGWLDLTSGLIVLGTLPLIPLFMALIGRFTEARTRKQYRLLEVLAHRFTDVVTGLVTLKAYGRSAAQGELIERADRQHQRATMKTLRIAFLSSLALELLATLSVALVAVTIGLRLATGGVELEPALTVLLVVPEAYLALRAVGTHYHASVDGLTAAEQIFAVLDEPVAVTGDRPAPGGAPELALRDVVVDFGPDRAPVALPDLAAPAGALTVLRGPSGSGKTTALNVLSGLVRPSAGAVSVDGDDLVGLDAEQWRRAVAYVGQSPYLFAGTVADNLRAARPDAADDELWAALESAALDEHVRRLPGALQEPVVEGGLAWSQGQRQRLAIARALLSPASVLLLDEPTSALDLRTEQLLREGVTAAARNRTIIVATHRSAFDLVADHVVDIDAAERIR